ncbi:hypothetical protein SLA2020_279250 [Shorea laevis]
MGARLSLNNSRSDPYEVSQSELCKRQRINYLNLKLVSRAWKAAILSVELYNLRKALGTTEEWLYILTKVENDKLLWYALDPLSRRWQRLPQMPNFAFEDESRKGMIPLRMWNMVGSSIKIADVIRGWLGKKDAFDRMRLCGCAIGAVDGCLYVLGGFSRASAMKCVWQGPGGLTPLQSGEVFDPHTGIWSQIPSMPFTKAQVLPTAFLADLLKPIATGMTSYRGRLFVPQSLYCWPFFVDVGGEVYDPEMDSWVEMPIGMGEGWPARQAGTKLSVTIDGELYALDPSSSLDSAKIKVYDYQDDAWKVIAGDVPIPNFSASESPYLLASLLGSFIRIRRDLWEVISTCSVGSAELVSCQTLNI